MLAMSETLFVVFFAAYMCYVPRGQFKAGIVGLTLAAGILYGSLEAPEDARIPRRTQQRSGRQLRRRRRETDEGSSENGEWAIVYVTPAGLVIDPCRPLVA